MTHSRFIQTPPSLSNAYLSDKLLQHYLRWRLGAQHFAKIEGDLERLGQRVISDVLAMADDAEAHPPTLQQFDAWGNRVDHIHVAAGWEGLHKVAAEEGLIAIGYERPLGAHSRLYQFAKLYLYGPSSAIYNCPLAMTDGAARVFELLGTEEQKRGPFRALTSRDPLQFWTSGQWMTEKSGGSDVRGTESVATPMTKQQYRITGAKWFSSATTAQMTMLLAKIEGQNELSLFYAPMRRGDGRLNGVSVERLKDKLGTKALPTAELALEGMEATLMGEAGKGVRNISTLFNITRLHNAIAAVGMMRRVIELCGSYARIRRAFGKTLSEHPLHVHTLFNMELEWRGALHMAMDAAYIQGRIDCGEASEIEQGLLRILTPLAKLYTAKQAVRVASEGLECFGGAGYIENAGIAKWLRDAQVLPIWEGTTNVLSLDVIRAMIKEQGFEAYGLYMKDLLQQPVHAQLVGIQNRLRHLLSELQQAATKLVQQPQLETWGRDFALHLSSLYIGATMLNYTSHALDSGEDATAKTTLEQWVERKIDSRWMQQAQGTPVDYRAAMIFL